jgi:hypothetical protein
MDQLVVSRKCYSSGMEYENFLQRVLKTKSEIRARCSGEMETLMIHEIGNPLPRIVPSKQKLLETVRKKVLRAFDKLLKRKRITEQDRTTLLMMQLRVGQTNSGVEISEVISETWPIVDRLMPLKER